MMEGLLEGTKNKVGLLWLVIVYIIGGCFILSPQTWRSGVPTKVGGCASEDAVNGNYCTQYDAVYIMGSCAQHLNSCELMRAIMVNGWKSPCHGYCFHLFSLQAYRDIEMETCYVTNLWDPCWWGVYNINCLMKGHLTFAGIGSLGLAGWKSSRVRTIVKYIIVWSDSDRQTMLIQVVNGK